MFPLEWKKEGAYMLEKNNYCVSKQRFKDEFCISEITNKKLEKYGINMDINKFKRLSLILPGRYIIVGSPVDTKKRKKVKLFNLNELSKINW